MRPKRRHYVLAWLLAPVFMLTFHYGPGQRYSQGARTMELMREAEGFISWAESSGGSEDWLKAVDKLDEVLSALPEDEKEARSRARLYRARSMLYGGKLYESIQDLAALEKDAMADDLPPGLLTEIRDTRARAHYGAAWVLREEAAPHELWREQAELSRQYFRMIAEQKSGPEREELLRKNLESAVRLERMEAAQISAALTPREARNGKGRGLGNKMQQGRRGRPGQQPGQGNERDADARGASLGERGRQGGS